MDVESAILVAITLACGLQLHAHPPAYSENVLSYVVSHPVVCTDVEMGRPCIDPLKTPSGGGD